MVRSLIECVKDFKSSCEFNDFNSDKVRLYEEVRKATTLHYVLPQNLLRI